MTNTERADPIDLLAALALEPIERDLFRGRSPEPDAPRIFGGLVIAQALQAAYGTVEPPRLCHSLQAYFMRPGDPKAPVLYEVERSREGRSFATRRVLAIQHGEQILNMAASFQAPEEGVEHQAHMPAAPAPETLEDDAVRRLAAAERMPEPFRGLFARPSPVELRRAAPRDWFRPAVAEPHEQVWFRLRPEVAAPAPDDVRLSQAVLAYVTDMSLLDTSLRAHGLTWTSRRLQTASLDHVVWFHRRSVLTGWHLYVQDSPSASGARGFNRGTIFDADGTLVASVAQEGLIRVREG